VGYARVLLISEQQVTEAFSTLLRWPGLRASNRGVLATKLERKMLASIHARTRSMPGMTTVVAR